MWVRLIFENSTVCLISRRISLFCPVDVMFWLALFWGVGWVWCRGFFDDDSDNMSVSFFVMDVALIDCRACVCCLWVVGVGACFSMESLILAQDERWRRA